MNVLSIIEYFRNNNIDFFTGVPDSQLKPFCDCLMNTYGISNKHIIAANEGISVAIAAGYYLATGNIPCIYMQNSGLGNVVNAATSLLHPKVYGIPCVFIIGWRGEPGVKDEPQHIYQGEVTLKQIELLDITYMILDKETTIANFVEKMAEFRLLLEKGKSVAFVVKKGALFYDEKVIYENDNKMLREVIIQHITKVTGEDVIVSTTGKSSRELFEIREQNRQPHKYDFLTVGSMGHSSSIALGIALNKPNSKVWCIDGDGALLMHMGAMTIIGSVLPKNLIHVVINNSAHETVGGMPTVANNIDLIQIALGCGYHSAYSVENFDELEKVLKEVKSKSELSFIQIKSSIGSRDNLGRPTTTTYQNKNDFMEYLKELG